MTKSVDIWVEPRGSFYEETKRGGAGITPQNGTRARGQGQGFEMVERSPSNAVRIERVDGSEAGRSSNADGSDYETRKDGYHAYSRGDDWDRSSDAALVRKSSDGNSIEPAPTSTAQQHYEASTAKRNDGGYWDGG